MNHTLRDQGRQKLGRATQPTAIAADSQSVKTTDYENILICHHGVFLRSFWKV